MRNLDNDRLEQLLAAARPTPPMVASVELHFEQRLMARLRERQEAAAAWSFWTWRLVPLMAVFVVLLGAANVVYNPARTTNLFAVLTVGDEERVMTGYLSGD